MRIRLCVGVVLAGVAWMLTGCGMGTPASGPVSGTAITGIVHGGQNPVGSSKVYLYAAGTTGYGTGATSLLNGAGYVTTDPTTGFFSISGDYTCPSESSLLYLVAVGGNPGLTPASTNNANLTLMAALGPCNYLNGSNYTLNPSLNVVLNEVTTVASVYALAQFMTLGTYNVGTSSTNVTGLTNAFATVNNLVSISTGTALATTPAGNGTVPQQEINSLADILASCVNSAGGTGACSTLMADATLSGGTVPTDTIGAALSIALNPSNNVTTLNNLVTPTAPFQPNYTYNSQSNKTVPNDWTILISYLVTSYNDGFNSVAIDNNGNVWSCTSSKIIGLTNSGSVLSGTNGYTYTGFSGCSTRSLSIDLNGNLWMVNPPLNAGDVVELSQNGTVLTPTGGIGSNLIRYFGSTTGLAIDQNDDLWLGTDYALYHIDQSGNLLAPAYFTNSGIGVSLDQTGNVWCSTGYGVGLVPTGTYSSLGTSVSYSGTLVGTPDGYMTRIVADGAGGVWAGNSGSVLTHLQAGGAVFSASSFSGSTAALALDGGRNLWTGAASNAFVAFYPDGTLITPSTGIGNRSGVVVAAVDGSGNVWGGLSNTGNIVELIGVATPTVTPTVLGVKNGNYGQKP